MLAKRIIPCLDVKNGRVVKGINFINLRDAGDPVEIARQYDAHQADELVFLDITASNEERDIMLDVVNRTAETVFMPLTVGGGIRTIEDIRRLLLAGADKISLNTIAVDTPSMITTAAERFGSQCIVVAIDARRKPGGGWEVYTHGGRNPTGIDVLEWVDQVESRGAGELLLTSMDADGTKAGYDNELNRAVSQRSQLPLIASGGAGNLSDLYDGLNDGQADAVLAASIFHFGDYTIIEAKEYLRKRGIPIRDIVQ